MVFDSDRTGYLCSVNSTDDVEYLRNHLVESARDEIVELDGLYYFPIRKINYEYTVNSTHIEIKAVDDLTYFSRINLRYLFEAEDVVTMTMETAVERFSSLIKDCLN